MREHLPLVERNGIGFIASTTKSLPNSGLPAKISWRQELLHQSRGTGKCKRYFFAQSVTFHNVESDIFERIGRPPVPFGRMLVKQVHAHSLR